MMRRALLTFIVSGLLLAHGSASVGAQCMWCLSDMGEAFCVNNASGYNRCQTSGNACNFSGGSCGGGGGCFLPGTEIVTAEGERPIEMVVVGDMVLGRTEAGELQWERVESTLKFLADGFFRINGTMEVTATHPFYMGGRWVEVGELELGDELVDDSGCVVFVSSIEWVNRGVRVLNLDVGRSSTFFANHILVHNKNPDPQG